MKRLLNWHTALALVLILLEILIFMALNASSQERFAAGDEQHWKGCTDSQPVKDEVNTWSSVCTDMKNHKYEVIIRTTSRSCHAIIRADWKDDYQHFECEEKSELLIRPQKNK